MSGRKTDDEKHTEKELEKLMEVLARVIYANSFASVKERPEIYQQVFDIFGHLFTKDKMTTLRIVAEKRLQALIQVEVDFSNDVYGDNYERASREDKDFLSYIKNRAREEEDDTSTLSSVGSQSTDPINAGARRKRKREGSGLPQIHVTRDNVFNVSAPSLLNLRESLKYRLKCVEMVSKTREFLWEKIALEAIIVSCPVGITRPDLPESQEEDY